MMSRNRLYWICQLSGWGLQTALIALVMALRGEMKLSYLALGVLVSAAGLALTHAYRTYLKRRQWTALPLGQLAPRALAAILLMAGPGVGASYLLRKRSIDPEAGQPWDLETTALMYLNWSFLMLVWSLFYYGIHFFWRYKRAEVEKWKLEADLKNAELRALKSQINPHFMFNMLNSVRALIAEDPIRAQEAVTQMARLLRTSLGAGQEALVPLEKELRTVRDYLALESIRFEERLQYEFDIDPAALATPTPAMLVQTLVENAVKHGVASLPEGGRIVVEARLRQKSLEIRVRNSGQLRTKPSEARGIGLRNAKERLKLHYGQAARLSLSNGGDNAVTAEILIPAEQA